MGVNGDLPHWFWWIRDNYTEVVFALGAGAVEVFGHRRGIFPLYGKPVNLEYPKS